MKRVICVKFVFNVEKEICPGEEEDKLGTLQGGAESVSDAQCADFLCCFILEHLSCLLRWTFWLRS